MRRLAATFALLLTLIISPACDSGSAPPTNDTGTTGTTDTGTTRTDGGKQNLPDPDPAVAKALYDEALVLIDSGRLQDAAGKLDEAIRNDPNMAQAYVARAKLQLEHGDAQAGLDDIDRALAINQELVTAYLARAAYYESTGDPADKARAEADMTAVHQIRGTKPLPKEVAKETKSIFDKVIQTDSELKP